MDDDAQIVFGYFEIAGLKVALAASQVIKKGDEFFFWLDGIHQEMGVWLPLAQLSERKSLGRMSEYVRSYPESVSAAVAWTDELNCVATPTLVARACEMARLSGGTIEDAVKTCVELGQRLWILHMEKAAPELLAYASTGDGTV